MSRAYRNITRIDTEQNRTHAWYVILQRRNEIIAKMYFSDGIYGGKDAALAAAIEYRDAVLSMYSDADHHLWVRTRLRKNNTSGIPGVGRYEALANPRTGYQQIFWLASWIDEQGASRKRKFYVSCYGENKAKRLAIEERQRQLRRLYELKAAQI